MAVNVNFYRNQDTGAPVIDGVAGSLITLLDAVLVNGYNSKTITITRSGATATATATTHGFNDLQTILISGANEADYNGTFRITNVTANTFDFTVANSPTTPATGTITAKVNPAGWAKTYSGTNKAVYRAATGNRRYYRIEDNTTPTANHAYIRGYEEMTDVDTGTGPFPNLIQFATPLIIRKSSAVSAVTRDWLVVATPTFVHLYIDSESAVGSFVGSTDGNAYFWGDFPSKRAGDTWNSCIHANASSGTNNNTFYTYGLQNTYTVRDWWGNGTAKRIHQVWWGGVSPASGFGLQYPCPMTGDIHLVQCRIVSIATNNMYHIWGYIPGVWSSGTSSSTGPASGDTLTGTNGPLGDLTGKKFFKVEAYSGAAMFYEISDTW